jgi:Polyketide cyclase / dehydrase and lipid transport
MRHRRLEFPMPATAAVVFDAFHHLHWRFRWDSLVRAADVDGGHAEPFVGAVSNNRGAGWLRGLSMTTEFITYDRPRVAAANMVGRSFPFRRWAASMRHQALADGTSLMIYTYSIETGPLALRWFSDALIGWTFDHQTRRRFARLHDFLATHANDVEAWQRANPNRNHYPLDLS